jgi:hypothetical protein
LFEPFSRAWRWALNKERRGVDKIKSTYVANSFALLPLDERIQQYREMADATFLKAQKVDDPAIRTRYLDLATQWHALAQQLESGIHDPEMVSEMMQPEQGQSDDGPNRLS